MYNICFVFQIISRTAVQWIHRCGDNARKHNQYPNSLSHQWTTYYSSRISSEQSYINEWYVNEHGAFWYSLGIAIAKLQ